MGKLHLWKTLKLHSDLLQNFYYVPNSQCCNSSAKANVKAQPQWDEFNAVYVLVCQQKYAKYIKLLYLKLYYCIYQTTVILLYQDDTVK